MNNINIFRIGVVTILLLLVPFFMLQFNDDASWTLFDFVLAGVLIFSTGLAYEVASKKSGSAVYRFALGLALAAAFLLVWINAAVGIIGNENDPANLLYGGVLAVLGMGTLIARFQARSMVRVLFAVAASQMLVPVVALLVWKPELSLGVVGVFVLNALFAAMWVGSALLFRRAALQVEI